MAFSRVFVGLVVLVGCGGGAAVSGTQAARRAPPVGTVPDAAVATTNADSSDDFTHVIGDEATWRRLASAPDTSMVARAEVVKFLIDLNDGGTVYFTNSREWTIHYFFARDRLGFQQDHWTFNIEQYRRPSRRFVCGSLVHYLDPDVWTFELISGDNLDGPGIISAFDRVRNAVYFRDTLKFRALSDLHERSLASTPNNVPVIATDSLLATIRYQPLTMGTAFGVVHIVHGRVDASSLAPTDIVVTDHVPDDLPTCQALITGTLQAPLAHVALLMQNRGSPNMTMRGATTLENIVALDGRTVRLEVGPQDFRIEEVARSVAETAWRQTRVAPPAITTANTTDRRLRDLCSVGMGDIALVGAKAAQLGAVCHAIPGSTPGGFVVPMSFYFDHLAHSGVGASIPAMATDPSVLADRRQRSQRLAELRGFLERANPDPRIVSEVARRIAAFGSRRAILRSSTNAEDLVGFNGAGLYESVVIDAHAGEAEVARALREVWASVWTLRGFDEREWAGVAHVAVGMAVLVQPFVEDARAIGVAVTENPFNPNRPAIFINVQARGGSVTGAGDTMPEQHMVYTYGEVLEDEVLSRSSITNGAAVLSEAETVRVAELLLRLHRALAQQITRTNDGALDVELIVRTNGEAVLLQARSAPRAPTAAQGPMLP